jgi:hypothetical protein
MNIPPFTNSHSLYEQQTVSVDRATVFPQSTRLVVDDDKLTQLDELLRANLGDLDVPNTRKRRKHNSSGEGHSALDEELQSARESGLPLIIIVYHNVSSIQANFYCKYSKSHLFGTKTTTRESVSLSVTHLEFYLEFFQGMGASLRRRRPGGGTP